VLALSIRQPFAELILRGIKTAEYRTRATRIVGERFWIYASRKKWSVTGDQWPVKTADNIVVPDEKLPDWMLELAAQIKLIPADLELPTGVIVGSAVVSRCEEVDSGEWIVDSAKRAGANPLSTVNYPPSTLFKWHLTDVQRTSRLRRPERHPQPVWFKPF
jgi:hypothetical protein